MEQRLRRALANRGIKRIRDDSRELSAVLLPLYLKGEEYYLVFTKRTQQVREHKGQISFPGGVYQEEDGTLVKTALRECAEEIGLTSEKVRVLGELDDIITLTSNYIVSPFVAVIPYPYEFRMSQREIEEIIEAPVSALLDKGRLREETEVINGKPEVMRYYNYQGKIIWGATARILHQFLDIVAGILDRSQV
jgi:8-oxo-dGTP pyrophosphatase MutT (NUDIX family)